MVKVIIGTMKIQIKSSQKTFNLEGSVEFGGDLRCVQITKEKINEIYVKNNIYKKHCSSAQNN